MQGVKKAAAHMSAIVRGMLFTGFTVQILLGLAWMCCNFGKVQDFEAPESVLYQELFRLMGGIPQLLYLLQTGAAFWAGYFFLEKLQPSGRGAAGKLRAVWRALVLLTCPFAMQCHLALLPCSFMNTLFLLMLLAVFQALGKKRNLHQGIKRTADRERGGNRRGFKRSRGPEEDCAGDTSAGGRRYVPLCLSAALLCCGLAVVLSGAADAGRREKTGNSMEAAMASRFAWPTLWIDHSVWDDDLLEMAEDVAWEASFSPGNMELLEAAIEEKVSPEEAKAYYRHIVRIAWKAHAPLIIRQIAWDVLGYGVTPVILPLQLKGGAYDSYTGRNYEIMCGSTPVLTRNYMDYYCWWFVVLLILTLVSEVLRAAEGKRGGRGRYMAFGLFCLFFAGLLVGILALRGAGLMDYKDTVTVNQLWLIPALLFLGEGCHEIPG